MATGFSRTLEGGHDAVYDYCCTTCAEESLNAEAIFYCKDCSKLLCNNCEKNHSKFIKGHRVLGKKDVDKWGDVKPSKAAVMCDDHPGKELEMYCVDHGCVYCLICINISHRSCREVKQISDLAAGIQQNQEFKSLPGRIKVTQQRLKTKSEKRVNNLKLLGKDRQKILTSFETLRKRLNLIDKLLKSSMTEMDKRLVFLENEIKSDEETCSDINNKMQQHVTDMETIGKDCDMFAFSAFKKCEHLMSSADAALSSMQDEDFQLLFTTDQKIETFLSSLTLLGTFQMIPNSLENSWNNISRNQTLMSPYNDYRVVSNTSYNVRTSKDKNQCGIIGMDQLPDGYIVIVDNANDKVKLVTSKYSVIDELQLPSSPVDICHTTGTELAVLVTLFGENEYLRKEIHFITAKDRRLSHTRTVQLDHDCFGITCHNGQLYVNSHKAIYLHSMSGKNIRKLYEDATFGETVFDVAVSHDGSRIYITNFIKNLLITLDSSGKQLGTLSDLELKQPTGVCVADNGSVFVCGWLSHTILQIDREGKRKMKTLATVEDGVKEPRSLCYNRSAGTILVGKRNSDSILELQLK